jgi:hypothetical protein
MTGTVLTVCIPTLAVLVGILINRSDAISLRTEIAGLRAEMAAMRAQFHGDIIQLLNIGREQEGRIARLEERQ